MEQNQKKTLKGIFATIVTLGCALLIFTLYPGAATDKMPGDIKGVGNVEGTLSTDVFNVVLPTVSDKDAPHRTIYDFILDPQKLLTNGSAADKYPGKSFEPDATLFFENILDNPPYDYSHTSDALNIQNKSTMSVDVKLDATLTGMENITLTNDSAFNNDKSASVYLSLTDDDGKTSIVDKYGAFLRAKLNGRPDAYKIVYDPVSNGYKYELKNDGELQAGGINFDDYTFKLTGACNTSNSWSKLSESILPKITVVWTVAPRPDNAAPFIGKTFYAMTKGQPNIVDIDLGAGDLAASGIESITFENQSGSIEILENTNYSFSNEMLTFNASYINSLIEEGVDSRGHTITFDDVAETQKIVTLTANDIAPSIQNTSYIMKSNTPVMIDIDMGSGNFAATGIRNISFLRKDGSLGILGTDMYTFADGTLKILAAHINGLLENGATSREYKIVLNDKANTEFKITLSAEGEFPSIESALPLTMYRDQPVSLTLGFGAGDLAATGIKNITCILPDGSIAAINTNMYILDGDTLTFKAEHVNKMMDNGIVSRDYIITFNNVSGTQARFTLIAADEAPSIAQTSYNMIYGSPVLIDINMGSGELGATSIRNITFVRKDGSSGTLGTDMYTFTDGTLKFLATNINMLLENGVTSREYTITLNDKANTKLKIVLSAEGKLPSMGTSSPVIMNRDQDVSVNVDLGSEELAATDIKDITCILPDGSSATVATNMYTLVGDVLTLKAEHVNKMMNNGITSRDYTITFNNVLETKVKFTLVAADIEPSITQTSYTMSYGNPVLIDINMGSGTLGATGIKNITFLRKDGSSGTLSTDMYTFTGGTLKILVANINMLLENGATSREYTITLNNKVNTQLKTTLNAGGRFPSVVTTSPLTMNRNQGVSLKVDSGTGDLAATGIKSITCILPDGSSATVAANMYTLVGDTLTLKAEHINKMMNNGITSRNYTITFNNVTKTQAKFTLIAANVAPSVVQTSYRMSSGNPVLVKINMGSGNLGATGIKSITFQRKDGTSGILATNMYTFTDGTLKILAAHINMLLENGATSREYTITLNDRSNTKLKITLVK